MQVEFAYISFSTMCAPNPKFLVYCQLILTADPLGMFAFQMNKQTPKPKARLPKAETNILWPLGSKIVDGKGCGAGC